MVAFAQKKENNVVRELKSWVLKYKCLKELVVFSLQK